MKFVVGGWIIVLVIVLALLISIWVLIKKITSKIESFSRMAFGTSDIRKGVEQMELEYFCKPGTDLDEFNYWKKYCIDFLHSLGINKDNLRYIHIPADQILRNY